MTQVVSLEGKVIEDVKDLEGLTVKVLRACADGLLIEVGGKRFWVVADYDCEYVDCSGDSDPTPLLRVEPDYEEGDVYEG